jgi:hypothetical protein
MDRGTEGVGNVDIQPLRNLLRRLTGRAHKPPRLALKPDPAILDAWRILLKSKAG